MWAFCRWFGRSSDDATVVQGRRLLLFQSPRNCVVWIRMCPPRIPWNLYASHHFHSVDCAACQWLISGLCGSNKSDSIFAIKYFILLSYSILLRTILMFPRDPINNNQKREKHPWRINKFNLFPTIISKAAAGYQSDSFFFFQFIFHYYQSSTTQFDVDVALQWPMEHPPISISFPAPSYLCRQLPAQWVDEWITGWRSRLWFCFWAKGESECPERQNAANLNGSVI